MSKWQKIMMVCVLFLLVGCENAEIKKMLQDGFDNTNPTGNRGVCFTVGRITYPYATKEVTGELDEDGYNRFVDGNNILNQRLAMFARLGLLSETATVDNNGQLTRFYQYNFTDEGKLYGGMYPKNDQFFCFGRVVVDSVGGMRWADMEKTWGDITYKYHIEGNIPEWAKSPELNIIIKLSNNNEQINWDNQTGFWPFKKTSNGLKPVVPPGVHIIGT